MTAPWIRQAAERVDLRWERDGGGDWILVGRNPDGNPVQVRTERAPNVRTSAVDHPDDAESEESAWRRYERDGNIAFIHDWWIRDNGRNQGSFKAADDFLDYFRTEKWARDGYQPKAGPADHHMETQEEANLIFERRMELDWGGPYDDDWDSTESYEPDEDEEDPDEKLKSQQLNAGQGMLWMMKHRRDTNSLPGTDDYRDPDEHLDPDDPRIKGAGRRR